MSVTCVSLLLPVSGRSVALHAVPPPTQSALGRLLWPSELAMYTPGDGVCTNHYIAL